MARCVPFVAIETQIPIKERKQNESRNPGNRHGVDVTRMQETVAAVKENPEVGSFHFRIHNRWVNGGENLSEVRPFTGGGKLIRHKSNFILARMNTRFFSATTREQIPSNTCSTRWLLALLLPWSITQLLAELPSIRWNPFSKAISTFADSSDSLRKFAMDTRASGSLCASRLTFGRTIPRTNFFRSEVFAGFRFARPRRSRGRPRRTVGLTRIAAQIPHSYFWSEEFVSLGQDSH